MEKAMAPHSSTLAWKIPWAEEPGRLQSMASLRVGHDWATSLSLFTFMHWRRKWQPTPVFMPGESQGRSLVGCWLWVAQNRTQLKRLSSSSSSNAILHIHPSSSPIRLTQWVPARTLLYTPDHSFFFFFCWSIVDLQRCVNFCSTTKWFDCTYFVVQLLSRVWLFVTQWTGACQASLSFTISGSLLKLTSMESVMPSNYFILCCPLLLPSIFPSIRVFTTESALWIRWPKCWSFSINPSNE